MPARGLGSGKRIVLVALLAAAAELGCSGATSPGARGGAASASTPVQPVAVGESDFAAHTYRLLLEPQASPERTNVLVGVVRRQLQRSAQRFEQSSAEVGLRALLGGFLLARSGEYRPEAIDGGASALAKGATEVARLGEDGYAAALYSMLSSELPAGPARAEVDAHLRAIQEFGRATQGAGPVRAAGVSARMALQWAVLEGTEARVNAGRDQLLEWMRRALDARLSEEPVASMVEQEDVERALRGGPLALVALYVRHGDPRGAIAALDDAELDRLVSPDLREAIEQAEAQNPAAWADLFRLFQQMSENKGNAAVVDVELMAGAAFASAIELFRAEPGSLKAAMPLAAQLVKYGMAEVVGLVLGGTISRNSPPEQVGAALEMVLRAMVVEDASGQLESARRTFASAEKIVALAESRTFAGRVTPTPSRLRYVMAAIEARHAELDRALALLQPAVAAEPTAEAFSMIAGIERQRKRPDAALVALDRVVALAQKGGDPVAETEALIQRFEILRDAGRGDEAAKALDAALVRAVETQRLGRPGPSQARVERLLARVLEHYGEQSAIHRATERAYEAASGDVRQIAATVLDVSRRSLTLGDLQSARAAAQRAIEANLPPDEIVYVALWLQLLERRLNVPSDGTVEEAYATIDESAHWPSTLRGWARGKISDNELLAAADGTAERTEAAFYIAMHNRGRGVDALPALRAVASSSAIELMEVAIARDLVAGQRAYKLPSSVAVP